MVSPFRYRPEHLSDPDVNDEIEWEDNWYSNLMAWVSQTRLLEPLCNEEHYISSRIASVFWTSCPCCLFWRSFLTGLMIGGLFGLVAGFLAGRYF